MTDFKTDNNNKIFQDAVNSLRLRFPNAEIQRATKYSKGDISNFLYDKKPVPDSFLKKFADAFKIDLREFGYTNGLERVEAKNPEQSQGLSFNEHYEKLINRYISLVDRLERELDLERSKNNKI